MAAVRDRDAIVDEVLEEARIHIARLQSITHSLLLDEPEEEK